MTTPAIACRGLSHRYGQTQAVADLDLEVRAGEAGGLLRPNGAAVAAGVVGGVISTRMWRASGWM
jgi:ABC-2 type transport system ATP-binding protein